MIAAICITGIFIYFFFGSRKVKKAQDQEWFQLGKEEEREMLTGVLTQHLVQKKRFNDRYWYIELEGTVYTDLEQRNQKIIWQKPLTPSLQMPQLEKNQKVALHGTRRHALFYANRIEIL